jgi:hypothetical protein
MKTLERTPEAVSATAPAAVASGKPARRHDLDRLRILAVLLLFPFHSARVFDAGADFYVRNAQESRGLGWGVVWFLDPWHMALLFVLAGMASWFAFGHRSAKAYAGERTRRLLIPFLIGLVLIVPPQQYLAVLGMPGADHSVGGFLAGYWGMKGEIGGFTGAFTFGHLWFVFYLFLYSLIALPLFVRLHRRAVSRDIGRPWMLAAAPFLLLVTEGIPWPEGTWNFFTALALFVYGFVLASSDRLQAIVRRTWRWILAAGVVTMGVAFTVWISGADAHWAEGSAKDILFQLLECSNTWLWVLGLIGAAGAFLSRPETRLLRYANEGAYPWYILHQTVIVAVAYVVVRWDLGVLPKYAVLLAASLGLTLLLYEVVVRRSNAVRFLFGLKPRPRVPSSGAPRAA